jgi:hypothetical protein
MLRALDCMLDCTLLTGVQRVKLMEGIHWRVAIPVLPHVTALCLVEWIVARRLLKRVLL